MEQKIWWYSLNNEQKGPVSKEELNLLVNQNFVSKSTLVWKEGLPDWISYSGINPSADTGSARPPLPPAFSQETTAPPAGGVGNAPQNNTYTQPQNTNGNAGQNTGYTQTGGGYTQQPGMAQPSFNAQAGAATANPLNFITDFYYRAEFERIINSNESYKGKWNWWAFFFSWVWCFTKGLWQYAILVMIPIFALPYFLPFMVSNVYSLALAIFFGSRGTYIYYNSKIKNRQIF